MVDTDRKIDRADAEDRCPVRRGADGIWQVRGYQASRRLLRSAETVQAGLGVETVEKLPAGIRRPVLYRDGSEHREHRRQTARYFTPRRVDEHYRDMISRVAAQQLEKLRRAGRAELSELSFHLAIDVAASVIGLTDSRPGIQRRLESFFPEEFGKPGFTSLHGIYWAVRQNVNWLRVYVGDVRPAVRTRRRARRDDLISHLIDEGCSNAEILGECLTFAAAGMVTTREFVNAAAWHLFTDEALRSRYRRAEEPERLSILHEIIRLEPVIGRLRRRTTAEVSLPGHDGDVTIPKGEVVDVLIGVANTDEQAVGTEPLSLCPGRTMTEEVGAAGLSFGDGAHKCPGAHVAMLETDIFLHQLFAVEGVRMLAPPQVHFNEAIAGYELRGLTVALDGVSAG